MLFTVCCRRVTIVGPDVNARMRPMTNAQSAGLAARSALTASVALLIAGVLSLAPAAFAGSSWHFAVSGDSRTCGDVVMPSIAAGARANQAVFYWHLGDLRAIYDFDEDFRVLHPKGNIAEYLNTAWLDFERNQIESFGTMPFFIGIGNHETIPPKTRDEYAATFADWLNAPAIREQRLKDDSHDHTVRPYYHWIRDGVDFISLDNATCQTRRESFSPGDDGIVRLHRSTGLQTTWDRLLASPPKDQRLLFGALRCMAPQNSQSRYVLGKDHWWWAKTRCRPLSPFKWKAQLAQMRDGAAKHVRWRSPCSETQ